MEQFKPKRSSGSSQEVLFTEYDENELVRINIQVEELHRQNSLQKCSLPSPAGSKIDCSSWAAPLTHTMSAYTNFDVEAAYQQITTRPCFVRLTRCDNVNYSPPMKKAKVVDRVSHCHDPYVFPSDDSSPCDSGDDGRSADYECTPSGSNGIKLVRKERKATSIGDSLKDLYRKVSALSSSVDKVEGEDKPARRVARKQTSRNSTYHSSAEADRKKRETLERVKSRTKSDHRRRHSPSRSRKRSLKDKMQESYRTHKTSSYLSSKLLSEEGSSNDEYGSDVKPRHLVPPAAPPPATGSPISISSSLSMSPPRKISPCASSGSIISISSPSTASEDLEVKDEFKAGIARFSRNADMPVLDVTDSPPAETKTIKLKEEPKEVTLPVTINPNARPPMLTAGRPKGEENGPPESTVKKVPSFPTFGPHITVSLVPPASEKSKAKSSEVPVADKKSKAESSNSVPPADKKSRAESSNLVPPANKKSKAESSDLVPPATKRSKAVSSNHSDRIKNEPIDLTDDDTPNAPPKSKIGLIKVRAPCELGIANPLKSFAVGMHQLCHLPSSLISPSVLQAAVASVQPTTSSPTGTASPASVVADTPSDVTSICTELPRDPRLANKLSASASSSPARSTSVIQSPVSTKNLLTQPALTQPANTQPATSLPCPANTQPANTRPPSMLPSTANTQPANAGPVLKTVTESSSSQSSALHTAVSQISSVSANASPVSKPAAESNPLRAKMEAEFRDISSRLYQIFKDYLKKNFSQKKKTMYERDNFQAFRLSVSKFLGLVSRYSGADKDHFRKNVRYYFGKLLRYVTPGTGLHNDESNLFINLFNNEVFSVYYDGSLPFEVLADRSKSKSKVASPSKHTQQMPNLGTVPSSQSLPPVSSQAGSSATHNRPNENQLLGQNGGVPQNQQNSQMAASSIPNLPQYQQNLQSATSLIQNVPHQQNLQSATSLIQNVPQHQQNLQSATSLMQNKPQYQQNLQSATSLMQNVTHQQNLQSAQSLMQNVPHQQNLQSAQSLIYHMPQTQQNPQSATTSIQCVPSSLMSNQPMVSPFQNAHVPSPPISYQLMVSPLQNVLGADVLQRRPSPTCNYQADALSSPPAPSSSNLQGPVDMLHRNTAPFPSQQAVQGINNQQMVHPGTYHQGSTISPSVFNGAVSNSPPMGNAFVGGTAQMPNGNNVHVAVISQRVQRVQYSFQNILTSTDGGSPQLPYAQQPQVQQFQQNHLPQSQPQQPPFHPPQQYQQFNLQRPEQNVQMQQQLQNQPHLQYPQQHQSPQQHPSPQQHQSPLQHPSPQQHPYQRSPQLPSPQQQSPLPPENYQNPNLFIPLAGQQMQPTYSKQPQQMVADNRAPRVAAPVSVPLVNSSQSPTPSYNAVDSARTTPTEQQPVSVNVVQSTSRTTPERTATEPNSLGCKEIDKADYDMYKKCTAMLKEFYQVTMSQFETS